MDSLEEENEQTVRELFETVLNGQQYDRIPEFCGRDVVMHRPGAVVTEGREAYEDHYRKLHATVPDLAATLTDVVVDGTRVVIRFVVTGTHGRELLGMPPTGRTVQFPAQVLFRLADGAIVEEFHQSDRTHLREQLQK